MIAPSGDQLRALLAQFPESEFAVNGEASRFARREIVDIAGVRLQTASAEDILITKLWWAKRGESERQLNDAAGVIQVQAEKLDVEYVERWVAALELEKQWQAARERAG